LSNDFFNFLSFFFGDSHVERYPINEVQAQRLGAQRLMLASKDGPRQVVEPAPTVAAHENIYFMKRVSPERGEERGLSLVSDRPPCV
jgi:hypothetical protein